MDQAPNPGLLHAPPTALVPGLFAVSLLVATGGCSLVLDFSDKTDAGPGIDAEVADAGPVGDGGDPCSAFEPNESLTEAFAITAGTYEPLGICPAGDHDFFSFSLSGTEDMVVEALFTNTSGKDLEMRLYDGAGMVIERSETFDNNERIERSQAAGGQLPVDNYFVEIFGFNDTNENDYTLVLSITTP